MSKRVYHDFNVPLSKGTMFDVSEGMTRQSEADQADINKILKRFEQNGIIPMTREQGVYADVSEIGDYRSALEQVERANQYFMSLPADVRSKFSNDPARLLDAIADEDRRLELEELGILVKAEEGKSEEKPKAGADEPPPVKA